VKKLIGPAEVRGGFTTTDFLTLSPLEPDRLALRDPLLDALPEAEAVDDEVLTAATLLLDAD